MTSISLPLIPSSLQLSPSPKSTYISTPIHHAFTQNYSCSSSGTRMCWVSTRPEIKPGPGKAHKENSPSSSSSSSSFSSEAQDLVRLMLRGFSDNQPLVTTLNKYVKHVSTEHCFLLFDELGRSDKCLQCLEVFRWMQKQRWYVADNVVYSKLISVMGWKGHTRIAMWLFSEMRNSGCNPDTSAYNALITAHLHSQDKTSALVKALVCFEEMKGRGMEMCKPSVVTYNVLLRAFARARNVEQVDALFEDLDDASVVSPDISTFNGVMDAYGKLGMITEMELVLSRMRSKGIKPDVITFNLLIRAYGRKREFDKMEQVFKSLLCSKEKPTLATFNSMITSYGKARLVEKVDLVFEKMSDMGYEPSFVAHECLMTTYGYCGRVSRARDIFDKMAESERERNVSTLNAMIDVYCMNGLPMDADVLFESARTSGTHPVDSSTYELLYKAYTKADMKEPIQKLLVYMDKDGLRLPATSPPARKNGSSDELPPVTGL